MAGGLRSGWKRSMRADLEAYKDFGGEPLKSLGHFDRMVDLGFLPINSQEGVAEGRVPADLVAWRAAACDAAEYRRRGGKLLPGPRGRGYTERAYVTGYMPYRLASFAWFFANLTDKVCVLEDRGIPVTYGSCFEVEHAGVPADLPFPATRVSADVSTPVECRRELKRLEREQGEPYTFVQFFDPTHGRPARASLYPDVVRCLQKGARASEKASRMKRSGA